MKISFQIEYRTRWGEEVKVDVVSFAKTGKKTRKTTDLATADGVTWRGEMTLPAHTERVEYRYCIVRDDKVVRTEWASQPHGVVVSTIAKRMVCQDRWRDLPQDAYRFTSAFTEAFVRHERTAQPQPEGEKNLLLRVFAPEVPEGQVLAVLGNQPVLGEWQKGKEIKLSEVNPGEWMLALDLSKVEGTLEYKYLTLDNHTGEQQSWEMRENRLLPTLPVERGMTWVMQDEEVRLPFAPWRGAGCVIPVFSIRSEKSFGVGDFGDLRRMIDWVALTGQRVLQILPINDTTITNTWTDSYPYNSISIYAFHPMYVDLSALPSLKDGKERAAYEKLRKELNALKQVDYEQVNNAKRSYLYLLFDQEGKKTMESSEYQDFYEKNADWLLPYAAFSYLRDQYCTADFRRWKTLSTYKAEEVEALCKKGTKSARAIHFYCYVQYLLHVQLSDACRYARSKGVVIKGDIPIGISRNSVEAWVEPHYFNLNGQAGAPPDAFSTTGQNWGFPTYNWDTMLADGCKWWVRRFRKMAEYFDAYRIDHVLGFFRIWEIPLHSVQGLLGQFSPALPMTVEEIESYGLHWQGDAFTRPFITDWVLYEMFGDKASEVRRLYLDASGDGHYTLKPEFATQRQVEAVFAESKDTTLRDGLYALISNVLFVPDRKAPNTYHPRIGVQNDYVFRMLGDWEKEAFNRLYNDYYYKRHNQFWYDEAMKKLPVFINATRMLVCAEDLGMVPACVPWVMEALKILTLEIQTMPKNPQYSFGHLWENPYRSVATISTHDMATLRGWWEEDWEVAQRFYNEALYHDGPAPHPMPGWLAEQVVTRHLESPSMLCLLSFQDWLSIDEKRRYPDPDYERINVPANPRHYWRYRMHMSVEQLMADTALNEKIRGLIKTYGR